MATVDPEASIARANSVSSWRGSGLCLDFVDWSMGRPGSRLGDNGGPPNGAWTEAKDGYYWSNLKHEGDMAPPAGVPCYWETGPSGNTAGHIVISLGGGWCRTTDYAGAASVSTQTIASITNARRGGYLGWTEDYGGNPIAGIGTQVAADTTTPIDTAALKAAADKKRRNIMALPLIAQQGNPSGPQYGLNIVIWDDGTYYWIDGATRDIWFDANAQFINCEIPGRFEALVQDAEFRKAIHRGQDTDTAREGAKLAFSSLVSAAQSKSAPLLDAAA